MQAERVDGTKGPVVPFAEDLLKQSLDDPEVKRVVIAKLPSKGTEITINDIRFVVERWRSDREDGITLTLKAVSLEKSGE